MTKTKYMSKAKYRGSLLSNLVVACVASECRDEEVVLKPAMVIKDEPIVLEAPIAKRQQQTFVMRWNPEVSNYKLADFEHAMADFLENHAAGLATGGYYFDWSIWDHQKVQIGDKFYMLKVGNGNTGIVMSGIIVSLPYKDEDWSGKGRDVRYVRMIPECMIHPDKSVLVTTQILDDALPGCNWNEGHSGVLLSEHEASIIDSIWQEYLGCIVHAEL